MPILVNWHFKLIKNSLSFVFFPLLSSVFKSIVVERILSGVLFYHSVTICQRGIFVISFCAMLLASVVMVLFVFRC